jgi:hypothetical protein
VCIFSACATTKPPSLFNVWSSPYPAVRPLAVLSNKQTMIGVAITTLYFLSPRPPPTEKEGREDVRDPALNFEELKDDNEGKEKDT